MVVNHTKTELIFFTKVKSLKDVKINLKAGAYTINLLDSIRALGVSIDKIMKNAYLQRSTQTKTNLYL